MKDYYSNYKFEDDAITIGESIFKKIISEKLFTADLLINAKPNVQLVILINLIHSSETECLDARKAIVRALPYEEKQLSALSLLIFQWLPIEPNITIKYHLYTGLIYNVQNQDELAFTYLINLIQTEPFATSSTIQWLSVYRRNRELVGKIYQAINNLDQNFLNDKDRLILLEVDKMMVLSIEKYEEEATNRILDEWELGLQLPGIL